MKRSSKSDFVISYLCVYIHHLYFYFFYIAFTVKKPELFSMLTFDWKGTLLLVVGLVGLLMAAYFMGRITAKPSEPTSPISLGGSQATGWRFPANTQQGVPAAPWTRQQYIPPRPPPTPHQGACDSISPGRVDPSWDRGDPARNEREQHRAAPQPEPEFDENFTPL